jgi:hypothetical protein
MTHLVQGLTCETHQQIVSITAHLDRPSGTNSVGDTQHRSPHCPTIHNRGCASLVRTVRRPQEHTHAVRGVVEAQGNDVVILLNDLPRSLDVDVWCCPPRWGLKRWLVTADRSEK